MENTESPRRIKPINIYYHYYSAQYKSSLKALKKVYKWVLKQKTAPVFTSEYLKMARDFLGVRIYKKSDKKANIFVIENYQKALTLRFEDDELYPDLLQSENVLGYINLPQGLYVFLTPAKERAVIHLVTNPPVLPGGYLQQSSGWVDKWEYQDGKWKIDYRGFGSHGSIVLKWVPPEAKFMVTGSAAGDRQREYQSDVNKILRIDNLETGKLIITKKDEE